jgi:DNA-binding beta-propeller fold protein YncE
MTTPSHTSKLVAMTVIAMSPALRLAVAAAFALVTAPAALADPPPAPTQPTGLHIVKRIPGPDGGWDLASFDPFRRRVYITHGSSVMTIDADTGAANPAFAAGDHLHAVAVVPGSDVIVTTNSGDDTARILSAADGKPLGSVPVAKDADGAAYDPSSGTVVVISGDGGALTLVDPKAMKAVGSVDLGTQAEFGAADGKGNFFVNLAAKNQVARVDLPTRKVTATYDLSDCARPTGIAYVTGDRLVVDCGDGGINILDASSGHVIASFRTGGFPDAVLYDDRRQLAFVPSALGGSLTVIALSGPKNNTVIDTVPTQLGARTGAVDPKSGRIYLPTAEYVLPVPPGQRPTTKPGTFNVLVLDR